MAVLHPDRRIFPQFVMMPASLTPQAPARIMPVTVSGPCVHMCVTLRFTHTVQGVMASDGVWKTKIHQQLGLIPGR